MSARELGDTVEGGAWYLEKKQDAFEHENISGRIMVEAALQREFSMMW